MGQERVARSVQESACTRLAGAAARLGVGAAPASAAPTRDASALWRREPPTIAVELFERVIQRVRQHAPGAAIAFNTTPMDCVEAALRWLR